MRCALPNEYYALHVMLLDLAWLAVGSVFLSKVNENQFVITLSITMNEAFEEITVVFYV